MSPGSKRGEILVVDLGIKNTSSSIPEDADDEINEFLSDVSDDEKVVTHWQGSRLEIMKVSDPD